MKNTPELISLIILLTFQWYRCRPLLLLSENRFSINSPRKEYMSIFKNSSFGNSNSILQLELKGFGYAFIDIDSGKGLICSKSFSR